MHYELLPPAHVDFSALVEAFNRAYADYHVPLQLTENAMRGLIERESLDMQASVVAQVEGQIVGSCMLGIRGTMGWIGGMGVVPDYRRKGLARAMLNYLIDQARQRRMQILDLEVIVQNIGAYKLYADTGFKTSRVLVSFDRPKLPIDTPAIYADYTLQASSAPEILAHYFVPFHVEANPWQRGQGSLEVLAEHMEAQVIVHRDQPEIVLGYALGWFPEERVQFMDIGIRPEMDNPSLIAQALVALLLHSRPRATSGLFNISERDVLITPLQTLGYQQSVRQYEMRLEV
jgi:ribosomal protein S18 acetylase RimI-like enzyme